MCSRKRGLRSLCITPCGLWSAGLGRSAALLFLPIALLLAAKRRLAPHPKPTATASPELCRGSLTAVWFKPAHHCGRCKQLQSHEQKIQNLCSAPRLRCDLKCAVYKKMAVSAFVVLHQVGLWCWQKDSGRHLASIRVCGLWFATTVPPPQQQSLRAACPQYLARRSGW